MKRVLLGAVCALLLSAPVNASPSVSGTTGLINTPSADVLRSGQFAAGYYHLQEGGIGVLTLNLAPKLELGVAGDRYSDSRSGSTAFSAKYSIVPETILTPGLALGFETISGGEKSNTAYAVASKTLPLGFRVNAGVGNGRFGGLFGAVEKTISPLSVLTGDSTFPATTLIAEYDGKKMNYGARLSIVPGLKLEAGWRNHEPFYGITFTR